MPPLPPKEKALDLAVIAQRVASDVGTNKYMNMDCVALGFHIKIRERVVHFYDLDEVVLLMHPKSLKDIVICIWLNQMRSILF